MKKYYWKPSNKRNIVFSNDPYTRRKLSIYRVIAWIKGLLRRKPKVKYYKTIECEEFKKDYGEGSQIHSELKRIK